MACSVFQPGLCECEWYGMSSQYKQVSDNSLECLLIQCIVLVILYGHTCIGDARVESRMYSLNGAVLLPFFRLVRRE